MLRDEVTKEFHEREADVSIDATKQQITITFMDSPLNAAPAAVKQQRANEVAAFVLTRYKHPLTKVSTAFASKRGGWTLAQTFEGHAASPLLSR